MLESVGCALCDAPLDDVADDQQPVVHVSASIVLVMAAVTMSLLWSDQ